MVLPHPNPEVKNVPLDFLAPYNGLEIPCPHLHIYAKAISSGILLTDDGYTVRELEISGLEFNTEHRKNELRTILNGFGINLRGDCLEVEARPDNFPQKKHNLIQAMIFPGMMREKQGRKVQLLSLFSMIRTKKFLLMLFKL